MNALRLFMGLAQCNGITMGRFSLMPNKDEALKALHEASLSIACLGAEKD